MRGLTSDSSAGSISNTERIEMLVMRLLGNKGKSEVTVLAGTSDHSDSHAAKDRNSNLRKWLQQVQKCLRLQCKLIHC